MKVSELIEQLKKLDQNRTILFEGEYNTTCKNFVILYHKSGVIHTEDGPGRTLVISGDAE